MARQVVVDIVGDASKFKKAAGEAESAVSKFGNITKGIGMGLGMGLFDTAANAVSGFVGQLGAAGDAYREDAVSQQMLAQSLKNNIAGFDGSTSAVESFAEAQGRLGFLDDDVRLSIAQLVGITHDQTKAMQLATLAENVARAKGIDLASATDIVTKAAQGNGKALKSLGIDIGGATDAAGMLDAIQKNVTGSAEAWAKTSSGTLAAANVKQDAAWEKIGKTVDKFTTAVAPMAADVLTWLSETIDDVSTSIQPIVDQYGPGLMAWLKDTATTVMSRTAAAFDWFTTNVVPALAAVISWTVEHVLPRLQSAMDWITTNVVPAIGKAFDWFVKEVMPPLSKTLTTLIDDVLPKLATAFDWITTNVLPAWAKAWETIFGIVGPIIGAIVSAIQKAIDLELELMGLMGINNAQVGTYDELSGAFPYKGGGSGPGGKYVPLFDTGGIVGGPPGSHSLVMAAAGEQFIMPGQLAYAGAGAGGGNISIHIGSFTANSTRDVDRLATAIAQRIRAARR